MDDNEDISTADFWKNAGDDNITKKNYQEAIQCYQEALEIDPTCVKAWNNLGYALSKLGRIEEARVVKRKMDDLKKIYSGCISPPEFNTEEYFIKGYWSTNLKYIGRNDSSFQKFFSMNLSISYGIVSTNLRLIGIKTANLTYGGIKSIPRNSRLDLHYFEIESQNIKDLINLGEIEILKKDIKTIKFEKPTAHGWSYDKIYYLQIITLQGNRVNFGLIGDKIRAPLIEMMKSFYPEVIVIE